MSVFFTADTHFNHARIIDYARRPFHSAGEMDEAIFANWAATVRPCDTVYHLGDVAFGPKKKVEEIVERIRALPGTKNLIPGNHDNRYPGILANGFDNVLPPIFKISAATDSGKKVRIVLCHYPLLTWDGAFHEVLQLYGHVHGRIPGTALQMDVGVDAWGFAPVRLENLLRRMASLPEWKNPENSGK